MLGRWSPRAVLLLGGVVVAGAWYLKSRVNLDPTDANNAINQTFNDVYGGGLDGEGTLGTDIADVNYEYSPYVLADKARAAIKDWWAD